MKKLFPYLTLISMSVFGIWVSFTWNIPVDNQIGMFFLSCMCIGLFFMVLVHDIRYYIKSKTKPQRF